MAQDGCQPMERFSFAKNGSAQKSWASCPSSKNDAYPAGGGGGGPAGGSYATRPYSVSGYVNGYNPSLPAYPPTRAQIEAAAKHGAGGGGAPARAGGGYSGEIADQMSAQIRFEQRRGGGGGPTMSPPPGQDFSKLSETSGGLTYGGHGAWDGPAPRGDPTKPAPGTPYYVRAPPEPAHDPSKEERDVKLGVGEDRGRLPVLGCDAAHAAIAIPLGYRHIRCGGSDDPHLSAVAAAIAAAGPVGGRDALFVSAKLSPSDVASGDVAAATAAILASLKIQKLDLLSIEWPTGDAATLARTWSALEALVASGKTTAIGLANASVPVVESVCKAATIKPVVNEVEAHPLMAHRKLVGVCRRYGVVAAAHAPLGGLHATLLTHPKLLEAAMLGEGGAEKDGRGVDGKKSAEELLARWSAQRGVPFALDAGASEETVRAVANVHAFRLTNSQKVLIDGMEPPPREGGVRFVNPPAGIDFAFDDPFLGGVARPGLDLEKAGAL